MDGLTPVWELLLIWVLLSVFTYSPPPPKVMRPDYLGEQTSEPDSFVNTIMWLNQDD